MNKETMQLTGKWKFIGAEKYFGTQWQQSENYVKEMYWEFLTIFLTENKTLGKIVETSPFDTAIEMAYSYNINEKILKIAIDESETDVYEVILLEGVFPEPKKIKINLLSQVDCPPPFFAYILEKTNHIDIPITGKANHN